MTERLGKYQLLRCLARGGMAEIWLGQQRGAGGFEKLVAVKRILAGLAEREDFVKMFLDEARLAAQLSHPNIAQLYDLGRDGESYYIAMEFIHGENLRMVTRRAGEGVGVPIALAVKIASETAQALYHAHTRTSFEGEPLGIVHRDISPQNVLVSYEGQVKVVDFGIAKAASSLTETRTGVIKGKHPYMSPEQVLARTLDARSDLFSLTIVLWELLTGKRLYDQPTDFLIMDAIVRDEPPAARSLRPEVDEALERLLDKGMAKEPDKRFQSGHEMHRALEEYLRERGELISSVEIAEYMRQTFPDRLETWGRVFGAREKGELPSQLLDELSDFIGGTPSSKAMATPIGTSDLGPRDASDTPVPEEATPTPQERFRTEALPAGEPTVAPEGSPPRAAPKPKTDISRPVAAIRPSTPARPWKASGRPEGMLESAPSLEEEEEARPARTERASDEAAEPRRARMLRVAPRGPSREEEEAAAWEAQLAAAEEAERNPPPPKPRRPEKESWNRTPLRDRIDAVFSPASSAVGWLVRIAVGGITIVAMIWLANALVKRGGLDRDPSKLIDPVTRTLAETAGVVTPGTLLVRSYPDGATVRVDGREVGVTPLTVPYEPERNRVTVEVRRQGYKPWKKTVENARKGIALEARLEPR